MNYSISNQGRVRNDKKGNIRKPLVNPKTGYCTVQFMVLGVMLHKYIHRLVAEAFVINPRPDLYIEIHHRDNDRQNNAASNIEWIDRSGNMKHMRKLKGERAELVRTLYATGEYTQMELAKKFKVSALIIQYAIHYFYEKRDQ